MGGLVGELWRVAIALVAVALAISFAVSVIGPVLPYLVLSVAALGVGRLMWRQRYNRW